MARVLITGGTGLIGHELTKLLLQNDYEVAFLTRNANTPQNVPCFEYNYQTGRFDNKALAYAEHVIHLAGAGVADTRWTAARKKIIIDSRVKTAELLIQKLNENAIVPKTFTTASGVGYYGMVTRAEAFKELSPAGDDFLAQVCVKWEAILQQLPSQTKTCALRTGVVLTATGGALEKMAQPIKWGAGSPLGSGKQMVPWIHVADLCKMYTKAIVDDKFRGAINAASPNPITNAALSKIIAKQLNRPMFLPNVPAFALKLLLGELSDIVLKGSACTPAKAQQLGFEFSYPSAEGAIAHLWKK